MTAATEPVVLVATSEFTLKSTPVRRTLEQRLIDDLKFGLRRGSLECSRVEKEAARLVVFGTKQNTLAAKVCSRVFGVAYAAAADLLMNPGIDDVTAAICNLAQRHLKYSQSFAVRAHRSTPGKITRRDVDVQGGERVLAQMKAFGLRVDLDDPDVTFYVDLVGNDAYVYSERFRGPGGLPPSAQWKMLAVLDFGPLSLLAAYAMMRRGCAVQFFIPVSKNIPQMSYEMQMGLVERIAALVTRPSYKAFVVEIDGLLAGQKRNRPPHGLLRTLATRFAEENRFKGVVLGNTVGALSSLTAGQSKLPLFYPLLGFEIEDLKELAELVGISDEELRTQIGSDWSWPRPENGMSTFVGDFPSVREVPL